MATVYWFGFMPDQALLRQIHSEAAFNCPRYSNPVVDALIEKARGQDLEGQKESYGEIQRILIDDVPRLVVVFQPWIYGVNKDLRGVAPHPRGLGAHPGRLVRPIRGWPSRPRISFWSTAPGRGHWHNGCCQLLGYICLDPGTGLSPCRTAPKKDKRGL